MGLTWGPSGADPDGSHVGPMNFAICAMNTYFEVMKDGVDSTNSRFTYPNAEFAPNIVSRIKQYKPPW